MCARHTTMGTTRLLPWRQTPGISDGGGSNVPVLRVVSIHPVDEHPDDRSNGPTMDRSTDRSTDQDRSPLRPSSIRAIMRCICVTWGRVKGRKKDLVCTSESRFDNVRCLDCRRIEQILSELPLHCLPSYEFGYFDANGYWRSSFSRCPRVLMRLGFLTIMCMSSKPLCPSY